MRLTAEQKREAIKWLHPRAGFIVDETSGEIVKWRAPVRIPTDTEIEQAHADMLDEQRKAALKAEARQVAIDKIAADVLADIDKGRFTTAEQVRRSRKYRVPSKK